jgi:hypothetical protein
MNLYKFQKYQHVFLNIHKTSGYSTFVSKIYNDSKIVDTQDSFNIKAELNLNADLFKIPNIIYIEKNSSGSFLAKQLFNMPTFNCNNETFNNHNEVKLNYDSKILVMN